MSSLSQIVPYELNQDANMARQRFDKDYSELISLLEQSYNGLLLQIFPPEIHSPYPIGVTLSSFYAMKRLTQALARALSAVVQAYFQDPRLSDSLLTMSEKARAVLKLVEKKPYAIGSWRPDILYPARNPDTGAATAGTDTDYFQVCEINARFPFNGFYASHEKNNILSQLSYLKGIPLMPVRELDGIPDAFCHLFDPHKSVGVLKFNHQEGWDVKMHMQKCNTSKRARDSSSGSGRAEGDDDDDDDEEEEEEGDRGREGASERDQPDSECSATTLPPPPAPPSVHRSESESEREIESKSFPVPQLSPRAISQTLSLSLSLHDEEEEEEEEGKEEEERKEEGSSGGKRSRERSAAAAASASGACGARFVHPQDLFVVETKEEGKEGQQQHGSGGGGGSYSTGKTTPSSCSSSVLSDSTGPLEQFVFECSTTELLSLDPSLLARIVACPHFNDLRTIFLAHDKRMLAVLSCPDILRDYVTPQDAALLQKHIIPTFIIGVHSSEVQAAKCAREQWVMKPNAGGKGVGIVFGRDVSASEWGRLLEDPAHSCFVLQRVVPQQQVDIVMPGEWYQKMLVVGLLHCFNENFLGPGIFRASSLDHPIVNVSGGNGVILSPAVLSCRWNLARRHHAPEHASNTANVVFDVPSHLVFALHEEEGEEQGQGSSCRGSNSGSGDGGDLFSRVWAVLEREGIAVMRTPWHTAAGHTAHASSPSPDFDIDAALLQVVRRLHCTPHMHSSSAGSVWDVRPVHDKVKVEVTEVDHEQKKEQEEGKERQPLNPRSKTAEAFGMHTDCSFEAPPPRYILLYVVREDRMGGGLTELIDTEVLLRLLSRQSLFTLMHSCFELRVPPEFHKGRATVCTPLISSPEKRFQYRSDIVVREKCTLPQLAALEELDRLLACPSLLLTTLLPTGSLLLLDNTRWFHGRSAILDKQRWLKRVRFNASAPVSAAAAAGAATSGHTPPPSSSSPSSLQRRVPPPPHQGMQEQEEQQEEEEEDAVPLLLRLVTRTHSLQQEQQEQQAARDSSSSDALFLELDRQQQQQWK